MRRAALAGLAVSLAAVSVSVYAFAWRPVDGLFSPPRRAPGPTAVEHLREPGRVGLRIERVSALDGQVPTLVVTADRLRRPGARGARLRQQLAGQGVALAPYGQPVGNLVLLHGLGNRKENMLPIAERFAAAGFRVILPDLPGHGDSPRNHTEFGHDAFERTLPRRVLDDVSRQLKLAPQPAMLWGYSMGGAYAVHAAAEAPERWQAAVIVSSFDRLDQVVQAHLARQMGSLAGIYQPSAARLAHWLGSPDMDAVQPVALGERLTLPVMMIHGDSDTTIDQARGRALFDAIASPDKQWLTVPEAGHRNVLLTAMPVYARMSAWMLARIDTAHGALR